jgi:hypothetical protein
MIDSHATNVPILCGHQYLEIHTSVSWLPCGKTTDITPKRGAKEQKVKPVRFVERPVLSPLLERYRQIVRT